MRKISSQRKIKCPMCKQVILAGDLKYHAEKEIRPETMRQSMAALAKLTRGYKFKIPEDYEEEIKGYCKDEHCNGH